MTGPAEPGLRGNRNWILLWLGQSVRPLRRAGDDRDTEPAADVPTSPAPS